MKTYLVGGAVRDKLLKLPAKDNDWVVVGANADDLLELGFEQVGKGFPVFLHPETKQEYALARTERKTATGHTGFSFDTSASVTLEDDLKRRDLTINAMAENDEGELIDPHNGQRDIEAKILRHVSASFSEDPLRVLRVAKFAARLAHLGFTVAEETIDLMKQIAASGELQALVKERVWQELEEAMASPAPDEFIRVLRQSNALNILLPEVDALFGVPQPEKYHPEIDTGIHTLMCLQQAVKLSDDPVVRYAALIHDVGKAVTDRDKWPSHYGHESLGLALQKQITERLHVPNEYAQLASLVCEHHTKLHRVRELKASTVLNLLESLDAIRRPERLHKFLATCEADAKGRTGLEDNEYPQGVYLLDILEAVSSLDIAKLLAANEGQDPKNLVRQGRLQLVTDKLLELNSGK